MQQISVSDARQQLPSLINRVFAGEEFVISKNNLKIAKLIPFSAPLTQKKFSKRRILPGATTLFSHLKGSTLEVADKLRESALRGSYDR